MRECGVAAVSGASERSVKEKSGENERIQKKERNESAVSGVGSMSTVSGGGKKIREWQRRERRGRYECRERQV